jgi:DNA-binding SARP family transcriptional activator/transcriptional regulator with XRE-family HTH domain
MAGPDSGGAGVGAVLRARRRATGLTQRELAERAGVGVGTVRDLEQGRHRPSPGSALRLAAALGLGDTQTVFAHAWQSEPAVADSVAGRGGGKHLGEGLWLQVLGPLQAWQGGRVIQLGAPKHQAVLGLLAVAAGAPVRRDVIIDALWGEDPPATAANLVQGHVSKLRQILDPGRSPRDPRGLLVSSGTSYLLQAGPEELDVLAFERLAPQVRAAASSGDLEEACERYEQALGLWRGEPLGGIDVLRHHPRVLALAQRWAAVVVEYADAAQAAGRHDRVVTHLRELATREPLNEKAHARLMTALAATGEQAAALAVFEELRRRLDEQLGVRPGVELADAHLRILRQEVPTAATPVAGWNGHGAGTGTPRAIPRQLPAAVPHFTGRVAQLRALAGVLEGAAGGAGMVMIAAISGTAGVGKTALAVRFAHQVAGRFPGGQLYVNLRGFGPSKPATPAEAIGGFLDALGVPASGRPASLEGRAGLYRSLLAGRRMLVLLDDARDEDQVRPLLPADPGCLVLITSRQRLAGLAAAEGADLLILDPLSDADARDLLARRLGADRVAAEPWAASELTALCVGLPLALSVVAARATAYPGHPLAAMADELRDTHTRLDALDGGDPSTSVRGAFLWSYRQLSSGAARMFTLLGIHPGPDISARAAASLAGISPDQACEHLRELSRAHLVEDHTPGRYTFHELLRVFAAELAESSETGPARHAATTRILDHYLHTAHAATSLLPPPRSPAGLARPARGVAPERLTGHGEAMAWYQAEYKVLLEAIALASEHRFDAHAWQLPVALRAFFARRGHWDDWAATHQIALAAARRLGDRAAEALTRRYLGDALIYLGRCEEALAHLQDALNLSRGIKDHAGQGCCHSSIARIFGQRSDYGQALWHVRHSLRLCRAAGERDGEARALNQLGWLHALSGNQRPARAYCRAALGLHRELGNRFGEAASLDSLGYSYHQDGRYSEAVTLYQQALSAYHDADDRYWPAETLILLGESHHANGNLQAARDAWQQALQILDSLHHPDAGQVRARLDRCSPMHSHGASEAATPPSGGTSA